MNPPAEKLRGVPLHKSIVDAETFETLTKNSTQTYSFAIKNVQVQIFNSKLEQTGFCVIAKGLGHELRMLYQFHTGEPVYFPMHELIDMIFEDFADFVVFERVENGIALN